MTACATVAAPANTSVGTHTARNTHSSATGATTWLRHAVADFGASASAKRRATLAAPSSSAARVSGPRKSSAHRDRLAIAAGGAPATAKPVVSAIVAGSATPAARAAAHGGATCSATQGRAHDATHVPSRLTVRRRITAGWSRGARYRAGHR